eukprot:2531260-Rhodomonas_salina.2
MSLALRERGMPLFRALEHLDLSLAPERCSHAITIKLAVCPPPRHAKDCSVALTVTRRLTQRALLRFCDHDDPRTLSARTATRILSHHAAVCRLRTAMVLTQASLAQQLRVRASLSAASVCELSKLTDTGGIHGESRFKVGTWVGTCVAKLSCCPSLSVQSCPISRFSLCPRTPLCVSSPSLCPCSAFSLRALSLSTSALCPLSLPTHFNAEHSTWRGASQRTAPTTGPESQPRRSRGCCSRVH